MPPTSPTTLRKVLVDGDLRRRHGCQLPPDMAAHRDSDRTAGHDWRRRAWKWMQVAAVFLVPVLFFSTYWFYRQGGGVTMVWPFSAPMPEAEPLSSCPMIRVWYSTSGRGFPIPRLNSTALRCRVSFEGEAFFSVAKDSLHPSPSVPMDLMCASWARSSISLPARVSPFRDCRWRRAGVVHLACFPIVRLPFGPVRWRARQADGSGISVEQKPEEVNDATAWQRNELVFRNATLRHVILSWKPPTA